MRREGVNKCKSYANVFNFVRGIYINNRTNVRLVFSCISSIEVWSDWPQIVDSCLDGQTTP